MSDNKEGVEPFSGSRRKERATYMDAKLAVFALTTAAIMLRLSFMNRPMSRDETQSRKTGTQDPRCALGDHYLMFFLIVVVNVFGYICQGILEYNFGFSFDLRQDLIKQITSCFLTGIIPGSVAGYIILSVSSFKSQFFRGSLAAFGTQTCLDLYITATGAIPLRAFVFCLACNFVGAPLGVLLALLGFRAIRRSRFTSDNSKNDVAIVLAPTDKRPQIG